MNTYCNVVLLGSNNNVIFLQLWDIREGSCKQTFPGHESDINAVTVCTFFSKLIYYLR